MRENHTVGERAFQTRILIERQKAAETKKTIKQRLLEYKNNNERFPNFEEALVLFGYKDKDKKKFRDLLYTNFMCGYQALIEMLSERQTDTKPADRV